MKKRTKVTAALLSAVMAASTAAFPAFAEDKPITVSYNGAPVQFDAQPEMRNERTMVPMRAVFEAFGCEVSYSEPVVTATREDKTITLTIGDTAATVVDEEGKQTITLDAAPYIESERTYVPVRFIAESLDSQVDWDERNLEVVVTNLDNLKAELEGKSEFIKWLLNYPIKTRAAYKSDAEMTMSVSLATKQNGEGKVTLNMNVSEMTAGLRGSAKGAVTVDASSMAKVFSGMTEGIDKVLATLDKPLTLDVDMVMDDNLVYYFKFTGLHDIVASFAGEVPAALVNDETWYKLDLIELLNGVMKTAGMEMNFAKLFSAETLWDGVNAMAEGMKFDAMDAHMIGMMVDSLTQMYGGDAVKITEGKDGAKTYEIKLDTDSYIQMIAKTASEQNGLTMEEMLAMIKKEMPSFVMDMTMTMEADADGVMTASDISMNYDIKITFPEDKEVTSVGIKMNIKATSETTELSNVKVDVPEVTKNFMDIFKP